MFLFNEQSGPGRIKSIFICLCLSVCIVTVFIYSTKLNDQWPSWKSTLLHAKSVYSLTTQPPPPTTTTVITTTVTTTVITTTTVAQTTEVTLSNSSRRFIIYGCSIHSTTYAYSFYTPIIASAWERVGYKSIVVFVGDFTLPNVLTARLNLSRNYLKHVGAHIVDIQCNQSYATKISQLVRVFSGFLPNSIILDDDDLITGDSDLMPLRNKDYLPTPGTDGFIFNAFCCGTFQRRNRTYKMFPMGHIYLKKKAWRTMVIESKQRAELLLSTNSSLLNENAELSFDLISLYSRHEFGEVYDSEMTKGDAAWYMDQVLCSMLLTDYRKNHTAFKVDERGRGERLDRADNPETWNRDKFDQFGDAHLFHDMILEKQNWMVFTKLLKYLFNGTLVNLFNDYYQQYVIAH